MLTFVFRDTLLQSDAIVRGTFFPATLPKIAFKVNKPVVHLPNFFGVKWRLARNPGYQPNRLKSQKFAVMGRPFSLAVLHRHIHGSCHMLSPIFLFGGHPDNPFLVTSLGKGFYQAYLFFRSPSRSRTRRSRTKQERSVCIYRES